MSEPSDPLLPSSDEPRRLHPDADEHPSENFDRSGTAESRLAAFRDDVDAELIDANLPADGSSVPTPEEERQASSVIVMTALFFGVVVAALAVSGRLEAVPVETVDTTPTAVEVEPELPVISFDPDEPYDFRGLDIHPDRMHERYVSGVFFDAPGDSMAGLSAKSAADFRHQLEIYEQRQAQDDNFTIRVLDDRTDETLEVFVMTGEQQRFQQSGTANWDAIDYERRVATRQLVQKWGARGVPKKAIVIRWGRADQVREARQRERRTVEYEVKLARKLGLSLLATEIGTVETFNQDWLVSPVKARSRYQMMPDIMAMFDVEGYTLPTKGGGTVEVREELNPLLSMKPALVLLKAYANAVGHEIPGISAYHTGPGNIFRVYETYLKNNRTAPLAERNVVDAYMWGVTEGFDRVDAVSSFGKHSRAYVLQAYGSLRATERDQLDPTETLETERVEFASGERVALSELLTTLDAHTDRLAWNVGDDSTSSYARFRELNPHMKLPAPPADGSVPAAGDVVLSAEAQGKPVHVFLPIGASEVLAKIGSPWLNPEKLFVFDGTTYTVPETEITDTDREYQQLVDETARFGFSDANYVKLRQLRDRFIQMAKDNPTEYRDTTAKLATIHARAWGTGAWRDLVNIRQALAPQFNATTVAAAPPDAGAGS